MTLIDKKRVVAKIERLMDETTDEDNYFYSAKAEAQYNILLTLKNSIDYIDTIELKETDIVEREVKEDAGGYPYIDATELYDYDNDKPLAKAGDKVKVMFIKNK